MATRDHTAGRGEIKPAPWTLPEIIVGLTTQYFGNFVAAPSRPIDSLLDQLEHHIGIVLQGVLSSEASQK